ncbi:hypothetical protein CspeluHIS016_0601190 [Cutaneotrichosporon spelunceum]|uniref:Xylanolytic transcriptional activator regulatory domain-containing protein n=1 Tax=Cutaneotrichosporon spelunceum TaxID=1672016 RepID=A0AAD3TYE2_9TREE|nr:hypothetical protein CspeluHIS016_0601190 [Cutaneotrichosporon spelunceum]
MSPEPESKPTSRSKLACTTVCARCSRYGLQCADPPVTKRKGRPPNSARRVEEAKPPSETRTQPQTQIQVMLPQAYQAPSSSPGKADMLPMSFPYAGLSPPVPTAMAQSLVDLSRSGARIASASNTTVSPTSGNYPSSSRTQNQNLNMAEVLDPGEGSSAQAPFYSSVPARRAYAPDTDDEGTNETDDPVSLHALSEVEAKQLVQLFMERLNPLVAVLDANLHTLEYLRRTSSVLFSTVLASSARFFRQDLHPALISHARTVLDRALLGGVSEIGVVQSLMIMTYWKDPEDTSGWMKVGMAIRLGYSRFWHIPRHDPLPEDEREARKLLNAERTWFCLFSFDRGQSYIHGLPTTIRLNDHSDPEIWARGHLHLGHSVDMHIAASIQLCKLKDHWGSLHKSPHHGYLGVAIETLTAQSEAMITKWFSTECPPPCFNPDVEHVLLWSILDFMFVMKRYQQDLVRSDPLRLDSCLELVARIADEIDILAANGMLVIMQDSASCMTSGLAGFAGGVFRYSTRQQKTFILTVLHRILLAHASVTSEDSRTAPAYVARYIRRVLSSLSAESRAGSPGIAEAMANGTGEGELGVGVDFFAELGLEEFMHLPEYVAQNAADDDRYWSNMLLSEYGPQ